jgi:small neutral amino acid transporter SnatA (MarC family)
MWAKARIAKAWSRWVGVYVLALMLIASRFRLTPLATGLFVGVATFATAIVITPSAERRLWVWVLASIAIGVFEAWLVSRFGPVSL